MNARYIFRVNDENAMVISRFLEGEYGGVRIGRKEKGDGGFSFGDERFMTEVRLPNEPGQEIQIEWDETDQLFKLNFEQNGAHALIWASGFHVVLD